MGNMPESTESLSPLKQALLEIRQLRARLSAAEGRNNQPIAIVGLGLRFPGGANDAQSYWRLLQEGVDAVTEVPPDRWSLDEFYDPDPDALGKLSTRYGAFLQDIDLFDPYFFGIAPREAMALDPQQRLLLEVSWEALENAGQAPDRLFGSATGVFLGISNSDYGRLLDADLAAIDSYMTTGSALSVASGRLSYVLGLHGPNVAIDTACSSSLVALHYACHSLRAGECNLALAGGVNLILTPDLTINFSRARMMAPDGRCKTFDARADGYVRGEGCGVVVLKRLSDAIADRDHIWAVIRGTAINHDGRSGGLTAPNGPAQEAVIRAALANGNVRPEEVGYVETHGTGTSLGDPIEVGSLGAVLGPGRSPDSPLVIGSVKTNLGHLEAAAGIASLIKAALALQHGEIPPHLHFSQPSPYIAWERWPFVVPTQRTPWPKTTGRRIAGVSCFGLSGTNAHIVLEEAPSSPPAEATGDPGERPLHVLTLSGKSAGSLAQITARMAQHLEEHPAESLADICYTANAGRSHFTHRLALIAKDRAELQKKLAAFPSGQKPVGVFAGQVPITDAPGPVFLFAGQGAYYAGMGRRLYDTQPTFRAVLDECDAWLRPFLPQPLLSVLFAETTAGSPLAQMEYMQPLLFSLEYALAQMWRSFGIEPAVVMGHSLGEYVAACVAGVFSLQDGIKLVAARGRLLGSLPAASEMVTVFGSESEVAEVVRPYEADVSIAAVNAPETVVISGRSAAMGEIVAALGARKIRTRRLPIARAAHSPLIDPILDEFEEVAGEIRFSPPRIALVSAMTAQPVAANEVTNAGYWRRHLRSTVRFAAAMQTLAALGYRTFIEMSPSPLLLSLGQRCVSPENGYHWLPSLREGWDDWQQVLESLCELYVGGAAVDWAAFDRPYARRRLPLPTYAWDRKPYWLPGGRRPYQARAAENAAPIAPAAAEAPAPDDAAAEAPGAAPAAVSPGARLLGDLAAALPGERVEMMIAFVRDRVASVLRLDAPESLDRKERLMQRGLDSLMAVELRNRLQNGLELEQKLPATLMFDYPTVEAIAGFLLDKVLRLGDGEGALTAESGAAAQEVAAAGSVPATENAIAQLSESEAEALLLQKLNALGE